MNTVEKFRASVASILMPKQKNAMGQNLARQFRRYGNQKPLMQDWSQIIMDDQDLYTGYPYSAINNRANKVAQLTESNLLTKAAPNIMEAAKLKGEEIIHPYLELIDMSPDFSNHKFWYDISTYLDLEGVYFLMAVRNIAGSGESTRVGEIQYFKLLNPYEVKRVRNKETNEIGGYVEARDGLVREIPPKMMIEVRKLNPFSRDDPFAMTDALKESQYTIKQGGDYTRHSLKGNMAAPGIISTDLELEEEEFRNFVNRITKQEKGVPLFGNGAGAITWDAMQIDLDKAALSDINEINREAIIAVSGASKTMLGIEQSGVTRETAKIQKDLFIENHVMPQLQIIIDALNQDYKTNYTAEYQRTKYKLAIDNPLGTDHEAELKDVEVRSKTFTLKQSLVYAGYEEEQAAKYAEGKITLIDLGEPTNEPVIERLAREQVENLGAENQEDQNQEQHHHDHDLFEVIRDQFEDDQLGLVTQQQGALQNAIMQIEARLAASVLMKINNQFEEESDIINKRDKKGFQNELEIALAAFYGIVFPLYATIVLKRRANEFKLFGSFKLNSEAKRYIKTTAQKAAQSHIQTIVDDLLKEVRERSLQGASEQELISFVKKKFNGKITQVRAKAIARTETNRAFTMSQFEADKQFIAQNGLQGKAYKKWITTSVNPCPLCIEEAKKPPIPFDEPFANLGDTVEATYTENGKTKMVKQVISFETVLAGNLHVNCACKYQLIIE